MPTKTLVLIGSIMALVSVNIFAADKHDGHVGNDHANMENHMQLEASGPSPREGGQSIFEALTEVINMLENDPNTDWGSVSIDNLHSHLVDMDRLMRETTSSVSVLEDNRIMFDIRGNGDSIESIHNMLPTHAQYIQQSRNWSIATELDSSGATLKVDVDNLADIEFLKALGFYGFMSLDSHHQAHHYQMVQGLSH